MYKDKSVEELVIILNEVCSELQDRTVGLADIGGSIEPIVEVSGNTIMTIHVGSTLGVSTMRAAMDQIKTNMFENGKKLSTELNDPFGFNKLIKSFLYGTGQKAQTGQEKIQQEH